MIDSSSTVDYLSIVDSSSNVDHMLTADYLSNAGCYLMLDYLSTVDYHHQPPPHRYLQTRTILRWRSSASSRIQEA